MYRLPRIVVNALWLAVLCALLAGTAFLEAQSTGSKTPQSAVREATVRAVKVLGKNDAVEIEVEGSDRLTPQTQVLTGPDRLVIDFPNAVPGGGMRSQSVDRGEVKDVRFGLFQSKPAVTRVVLDLKRAQNFQVFPYGRTVMIKIVGAAPVTSAGVDEGAAQPATRPGLVAANYTTGAERVQVEMPVQSPLTVTFQNGLLAIQANKATLSEVLFAVHQRTGAEVAIAAGAEQEKVVVDLGPAPAPEVIARLLKGSNFNFLILSAANDPGKLDRVILSPRAEGGIGAMPLQPVRNETPDDDDAAVAQTGQPHTAPEPMPQGPPDVKAADDNTPDQ